MIEGLLYSNSGMNTRMQQLEVVSNNLANSNTVGFKRDVVFNEALSQSQNNQDYQVTGNKVTDFTAGFYEYTGNKLDLALNGEAFFTVDGPNGPRYTRNGHFNVNSEGVLCTNSGSIISGERGPIVVGSNFKVNAQGEIFDNDVLVDRLCLVEISDVNQLRKEADSFFMLPDDSQATVKEAVDFEVKQGYLEKSNVNPVEEMVSLIEIYRLFEADQKAIKEQDDTLNKAINDVGRVAV